MQAIQNFARERNKKIITIGGYHSFSDLHFSGTPFEALDYFRHADYVFTDTFHGSIFSIINKRKFVVFVRSSANGRYGNSEKLLDLLGRLNLTDRCVSDLQTLSATMDCEINYDAIDPIVVDFAIHRCG